MSPLRHQLCLLYVNNHVSLTSPSMSSLRQQPCFYSVTDHVFHTMSFYRQVPCLFNVMKIYYVLPERQLYSISMPSEFFLFGKRSGKSGMLQSLSATHPKRILCHIAFHKWSLCLFSGSVAELLFVHAYVSFESINHPPTISILVPLLHCNFTLIRWWLNVHRNKWLNPSMLWHVKKIPEANVI
jgi:hypothetical protein